VISATVGDVAARGALGRGLGGCVARAIAGASGGAEIEEPGGADTDVPTAQPAHRSAIARGMVNRRVRASMVLVRARARRG
jgi:hypothetical protein